MLFTCMHNLGMFHIHCEMSDSVLLIHSTIKSTFEWFRYRHTVDELEKIPFLEDA